jgi:hypothetical protein
VGEALLPRDGFVGLLYTRFRLTFVHSLYDKIDKIRQNSGGRTTSGVGGDFKIDKMSTKFPTKFGFTQVGGGVFLWNFRATMTVTMRVAA